VGSEVLDALLAELDQGSSSSDSKNKDADGDSKMKGVNEDSRLVIRSVIFHCIEFAGLEFTNPFSY